MGVWALVFLFVFLLCLLLLAWFWFTFFDGGKDGRGTRFYLVDFLNSVQSCWNDISPTPSNIFRQSARGIDYKATQRQNVWVLCVLRYLYISVVLQMLLKWSPPKAALNSVILATSMCLQLYLCPLERAEGKETRSQESCSSILSTFFIDTLHAIQIDSGIHYFN